MSAFFERLQEQTKHLPDPRKTPRPDIDTALAGIIGHTRMKYIPVQKGGIALAMLTDNPASTHYDEVFAALLRMLEGRNEQYPGYKNNPKLVPTTVRTLVETSSGSAGPSIAWIARAYGYNPLVVIPQGMRDAFPARAQAHNDTLGTPLSYRSIGERADHVITHAKQGKGGLVEAWYGDYANGTHMTGMVKTVAELHQAWQTAGKPADVFFLNHSRRPEASAAFAETGRRLLEQAKREHGIEIGTFVGAIGNGTTIEGVSKALRERCKTACVHAFEAKDDVPGISNLGGIAMPNIHRAGYDRITNIDSTFWAEAEAAGTDDPRNYNVEKPLADTVGRSTIAGLNIARQEILNGRSLHALVLAYDRRDRYETVIDKKEAVYKGEGRWE